MNRGDRREAIFGDDLDRRRFVETLAQACVKTGWQVHYASISIVQFALSKDLKASLLR